MKANTRVSFLLGGKTAYGTTVADELGGSILVAVDANYMQGSQGILKIVVLIASVSLTEIVS